MTHTSIFEVEGAQPGSFVPERFWTTPATVARRSLEAAQRGRPVVSPGVAYAVLAPVAELLPPRLGARLAARADGVAWPPLPEGCGPLRYRDTVVVGDNPGAASALVAAVRARGGRVRVLGPVRPDDKDIDEYLPLDLASPDDRAVAAEAGAGADLVLITGGGSRLGPFEEATEKELELAVSATIPAICDVARAAMKRAASDTGPTVVFVGDERGLRGDVAEPVAAGVNAFLLSLGASLALQTAGTGGRVASAVGGLAAGDAAAGERALDAIDHGAIVATGNRLPNPSITPLAVAVRRRGGPKRLVPS